jgi:hypothetical protein
MSLKTILKKNIYIKKQRFGLPSRQEVVLEAGLSKAERTSRWST